jgi:hypothetical protein
LDGSAWKLEPFPPSSVEEYEIEETGRTRAVVKNKYYNIGDRPFFKPLIPYDCEYFFKFNLQWGKLAFHLMQYDACTFELLHVKLIVLAQKSVYLTSFIISSVASGDSKCVTNYINDIF